jgi:signal peptide peptidase SppA
MHHLMLAFFSTPWAVEPGVLRLMSGIVERWAAGVKLPEDEIRAAIGDAPEAAVQRRESATAASGRGVAVVPVYGVLAHRQYAVENVSRPLTSTERLAGTLRQAASDPDVGTIVLDIDSPGGSVFGVQELGDALADIRANSGKRLVAVANNTAASGAYWIASQADEIVVTPSGMVGSIGVIVPHTDLSAAYEKAGVKRTYVTYGKYKAEGNETAPLDDDARGNLQAMVDAYGAAFTKAVAKGRGVPVDVVRGPAFGEGRIKIAREAVESGMADRIGTLEDTIARYARSRAPAKTGMRAENASRDIEILEA